MMETRSSPLPPFSVNVSLRVSISLLHLPAFDPDSRKLLSGNRRERSDGSQTFHRRNTSANPRNLTRARRPFTAKAAGDPSRRVREKKEALPEAFPGLTTESRKYDVPRARYKC
ncbi:hypothetical protein QE152_g19411 [Popillia japonica]|uniref:Uncharacterized protein n=1 Tax=Popillia japonica TaxID=7064 RepID=A0AAW1KSE0_POPJA